MLLAMDTATTTASLALLEPDSAELLAEVSWQARRRQTQELMAAALDLLAHCDRSASAITALATTTGPGSFTGTRIAIATAKGIGIGFRKPGGDDASHRADAALGEGVVLGFALDFAEQYLPAHRGEEGGVEPLGREIDREKRWPVRRPSC